nr:LOW QUALITY PROTEIN: dentin matrix acidic phosphoprotein 1-like [Columba livia]
MLSLGRDPVLGTGDAVVVCARVCVCVSRWEVCEKGINLAVKTQGRHSQSLAASPSRHPKTTRSFFRAGVPAEARGSVGGRFPVTPPRGAVLPAGAIGCPWPGAGAGQWLNARTATPGHTAWDIPLQAASSPHPQHWRRALVCTTPRAARTATNMRSAFLMLFLWVVAYAHPVPSQDPTRLRRGAQQEDIANEGDINELGGGDGRHPPAHVERGDNALAGDLAGGNAVGKELSSRDEGDRAREVQHLNQVDHEDTNAGRENSLGFLEEDARDAADGDDGEHPGTGRDGLPPHAGGLLDEEDDSGDDTFDANREEEEGGEGPTYVAGVDGAGEDGHDFGRGDAGAGRGHGDSSSSSSSESISADHRQYRNYRGSWYERTYRQGGGSSSSQEEESYDFEDEAMQGDDPSVFDGPGSSYKGHRAGPRALGSSRESIRRAGSYRWEEGNSRSPEVEDTQSEEDSPSVEDFFCTSSQSEENSPSQSEEEEGDREDSHSREGEGSKSRDEELGDSPEDISQEVVSTSSEHRDSQSQEGQEDQESAEDRSVPSVPDSKSEEEQGDQSESGEDDGDQSQSPEDTREESQEDRNDSNPDGDVPSTSAESQSASPEDDGSQEDDAGEDSRSTESNNSESQEDDHDDDEESHSQEDQEEKNSDGIATAVSLNKRKVSAVGKQPLTSVKTPNITNLSNALRKFFFQLTSMSCT